MTYGNLPPEAVEWAIESFLSHFQDRWIECRIREARDEAAAMAFVRAHRNGGSSGPASRGLPRHSWDGGDRKGLEVEWGEATGTIPWVQIVRRVRSDSKQLVLF